jgi:hypothetical protein
MPRYIVERTFTGRVELVSEDTVRRNGELGVTWLHSYVSKDRRTSFCVYEAPSQDAIRATAVANDLPVDQITEVNVLDPHFYR